MNPAGILHAADSSDPGVPVGSFWDCLPIIAWERGRCSCLYVVEIEQDLFLVLIMGLWEETRDIKDVCWPRWSQFIPMGTTPLTEREVGMY